MQLARQLISNALSLVPPPARFPSLTHARAHERWQSLGLAPQYVEWHRDACYYDAARRRRIRRSLATDPSAANAATPDELMRNLRQEMQAIISRA